MGTVWCGKTQTLLTLKIGAGSFFLKAGLPACLCH